MKCVQRQRAFSAGGPFTIRRITWCFCEQIAQRICYATMPRKIVAGLRGRQRLRIVTAFIEHLAKSTRSGKVQLKKR
ncbi:hypothetical protein KCP69_00805 [Salmonella enterica subsp. enterica]|nr:hypothetical protein KCP69_00805 [Salmonella enterica subsp. enterica]